MKTFENQKSLPRLPIPSLENTISVYLQSLKPYVTPQEFQKQQQICADFIKPNGLGVTLQQRLIAHDKTQPNSWLEKWWLEYAYLTWRNSVMIHSNWFLISKQHPEAPKQFPVTEGYTPFQVYRAAGLISNFLNYKDLIDNEVMEPDTTKQGPLDMNQLRKLFGVTRVPKPGCDIIVESFPCRSRHIIVLVNDQMFVVDVIDKNGLRLKLKDIEKQLNECIKLANQNVQSPVCILSAQHRDNWAQDHIHLSTLGNNKANLHVIEQALFCVALDHKILARGATALAKNTFHGFNGHNRWFDKSLTIIVTNDGQVGLNGEHSPCDALIPSQLADYACKNEPAKEPASATATPSLDPVRKLQWTVDQKIKDRLLEAQIYIDGSIADSDVQVFHYKGYGGNFIKQSAKVSPDAFQQMCLQLTFYRLHGYCAGVYETASTRKYLHGRTETCRSHTFAQKQFVEKFENAQLPSLEKYKSFEAACKAHVQYLGIASNAMGCDRHLLGLQLCMKEGESHDLYKQAVYARSSKWQLSTSGLFPSKFIDGTGFGTVYPDGYGMNYVILPEMIKLGIESKFSCLETGTLKFTETLKQVYEDVRKMCEDVNPPPAKL